MSSDPVLIETIASPTKNAIVGGPFGSNLVSKDYVSDGIPVIRGQNMGERWIGGEFVFVSEDKAKALEPNKARPGDLVFTQRGTLGQVAIVPSFPYAEYIVSQSQMKLTPDPDKADVNYLYYAFLGSEQQEYIRNNAIQTGVPHTNLGILKKTPIILPSLSAQREIASLLGALDDRISFLRESNATLEAIAQALFKSWFVDFDPVRAKMEGRAPEGMDEATAALFPDSFEESELGLVPRGWGVGNIYEVAKVTYGAPFSSKLFKTEPPGKPLVRIRDLRDECPGVFTEEVHPKGYLLQPGDIVVGMDGEFRAYLWGGEEAWLNQRVCVFQPKNGASSAFVRLSISPLLAAVEASETATTVIHLGKNDIDRFKIVMPSKEVLDVFSKVSIPLYERGVKNKQQAQTLAALRDTLLPRLISGQLRLSID